MSPELLVQIQNSFTELFLIMSSTCSNGYSPQNKRAARALGKKYFWTTSEQLVQIQNNFTEGPLPKLQEWFHSTEQKGLQSSR